MVTRGKRGKVAAHETKLEFKEDGLQAKEWEAMKNLSIRLAEGR